MLFIQTIDIMLQGIHDNCIKRLSGHAFISLPGSSRRNAAIVMVDI